METKPYTRKVFYYETDMMGIVHHSNFIRWFEEARVDFMEQFGYGYDESVAAGIDIVVLKVACEFKSMIRFGDTVVIEMKIASLEATRMAITYHITDARTGELRATGESGHCYYSRHKNRPVSLKKELPELYDILMGFV